MSLDTVLIPELAEFATRLTEHEFKVYVFKSDVARIEKAASNGVTVRGATHFGFSRLVDGQECFASVSRDLGGYRFNFPITPSREHGSGMFIGGSSAPEFDDLNLFTAIEYASPTASNYLVGTHKNDNALYADLYVEVTP